jgi:hypothetical protein
MYINAILTLIAAALAGGAMGSFLLLSVLHRPLISSQLDNAQKTSLYRRFYRLNTALCLIAGILAALIKNQQAALLLSILAMSYVFTQMHVLNGIIKHSQANSATENQRALKSLKILQNSLHFFQFLGAGWAVYYLY